MIETGKTILLVIITIYAIVLSVLYFMELQQKETFQKDKIASIIQQKDDLDKRESIVVDKEICFRELAKLKTIQSTALDVLKSYSPSNQSMNMLGSESMQSVSPTTSSIQSIPSSPTQLPLSISPPLMGAK